MKRIFISLVGLVLLFGLVAVANAYDFPSTNELNKNGENTIRPGVIGPHVNLVEAGSDYVTLEFVMPEPYLACFEYRSDGESSQYGDIYAHPVIEGDYFYYYLCINNTTEQRTFQANEYIEVRSAFGGERDWDFDWTRFDVLYPRTAEITSPGDGEIVAGTVSFDAILDDKDGNDSVQWAVRKGTCAAGTNTVFGNVDGVSDAYDWDGASFHAEAVTSTWDDGAYCFIFNPTESAGDLAIRETREFVLDNSAPVDKDECKKGGWESFAFLSFKNQGACVSYVEANEKAGKR